jgi:hypothetical protein
MHSERLTLAEVSKDAAPLSSAEVAAIIAALCQVRASGDPIAAERTQMRPDEVWLDRNGTPHVAPGVMPTASEIGGLLEWLLAEIRRGGASRFPPGLVMVAARATGRIDMAPILSCDALASALERFKPPDPEAALKALFDRANRKQPYAQHIPPIAQDGPPPALPVTPRRERRAPLAAAAVLALSASFAAGFLFVRDTRSPQITDTTEVVVRPPNDASLPSASKRQRPAPREVPAPTSGTPRARRLRGRLAMPQPLVEPTEANGSREFSPSFDQNGSAVFFHAESGSGSALKRAEPGEAGVLHVVTILDDAAKNYHVQLSPDGRSVAFDSDRDGVRGVYVARADGSQVRRVSGEGYAAVPTWSPDGSRLAFLRGENDRPNVWNLWVLDVASREMTRLTRHRYGQVWGGAWFPDGRRLASSHEDQLHLLELGTGRTTSYASPLKGRLVRTPAVSPDGHWIIFQVLRDGAWLLNVDDGSMRRVLDDSSAEEFAWAPDGKRVAFHSRRRGDWGLWVMAAR